MKTTLLLALFVTTTLASAQVVVPTNTRVHVPTSEPREHSVDMTRLTIDVKFDPVKGLVRGKATNVFRVLRPRLDSIVFDAVGITVSQATLSGKPVRWRSTDTTLVVYCEPAIRSNTSDSVVVTYEAAPRKGLHFVGWNDASGRMRRQIWTQGQAIDHRHWIPMYDEMNDKMITETIITFDSSYAVLSNGTLHEKRNNNDGTFTWHYSMTRPHASYLLMLAIGKYAIERRRSTSGIVNDLYYYPECQECVTPTYRLSTEAVDFLERELDVPYPWEKYSQIPVADYIFGAMENTTATVFGDFYFTDPRAALDRNYLGVNVHELTHQWFGDLITARSSKHVWLQESFATFYPHLFTKLTQGVDAWHWSRRGMQRSALAAGEKDRLPIVHPSSGSARLYPKGACVIDMMRWTYGEEQVRNVITHYLKKHAYANVETNDLYLAFQDVLGLTPWKFFEQWLYKGGEPLYEISWSESERLRSLNTDVSVEQRHETDDLTGLFDVDVAIEVHYTDRTKDSVRVRIHEQRTTVSIPNPRRKQVEFVLFDPGSYILKRLSFRRPYAELLAQFQHAPFAVDRSDALQALVADSIPASLWAALATAMTKETYASLRAEIAAVAASKGGAQAEPILRQAINDPSSEVRQAAVSAMSSIPSTLRVDVEKLLRDSSYITVATTLTKLVASFPEQRTTYLTAVGTLRGQFERVRIAVLESLIHSTTDTAALRELVDLGSPGWEFRTRQEAFAAWKRLGLCNDVTVAHLLSAVMSTNNRLAAVATSQLESWKGQTQWAAVIRTVAQSMEPTVDGWRREALQPWIK